MGWHTHGTLQFRSEVAFKMTTRFVPSKLGDFGPTDSEGFRSFSLFTEHGVEIMKVSLHLERFEREFTRTASQLEQYSEAEIKGLKGAAVLAAARQDSAIHDPSIALTAMLDLLIPRFVAEQTEKHFPNLTRIAMDTVSEACVSYAINGVVESNGAPPIYDAEKANRLTRPLTNMIRKEFLRVKAGRPSELQDYLSQTREALRRLKQRRIEPTLEEVAHEIGVTTTAIRGWLTHYKLTWEEWLTATQWEKIEKTTLPEDWVAHVNKLRGEEN